MSRSINRGIKVTMLCEIILLPLDNEPLSHKLQMFRKNYRYLLQEVRKNQTQLEIRMEYNIIILI